MIVKISNNKHGIKLDWIKNNPFKSYISRSEPSNRRALTSNELRLIENLVIEGSNILNTIRDMFISSKFISKMSWHNYSIEWQLDRVIPFCDFNLSDPEEANKCFHYTNVQPLFIQTKVIDGVHGEYE